MKIKKRPENFFLFICKSNKIKKKKIQIKKIFIKLIIFIINDAKY